MSKVTRLLLRVAAICMLTSGSVVLAASSARADSADEAAFVSALNQLRSSRGLAPLAVNAQLTGVAEAWAAHMAAIGALAHNANLAAQAPPNWMAVGENVGVGASVSFVQSMFLASAHHFGNMVGTQYNQVGVGVVPSNGMLWVVEDFLGDGYPLSPPAPPPTAVRPAPSPPATPPARPPAQHLSATAYASTSTKPLAMRPVTSTTVASAQPAVNLDSASRQLLYFNNWD